METTTTAKDKNKANGTTPETAVLVAEQTGTAIAKADSNVQRFKTVDLENAGDFPDLETASVLPMDLMSTYWTPETPGESKNVVFSHIDDSELIDQDNGEIKILPTAHFFEQKNGEISSVRNASKRLVGAIESSKIVRGTPLRISYLGKKKNVNNAFKSDDWSVKPLLIK
ncbi:MAG: hypothetical protein KAY48_01720 [Saprospiraceae bacterium]|nr:hypothetical protein [Saprospiraceae bacterium]